MIRNPILTGFHPDPSICRVADDFYLVTSSFSFYPGVPIFHSRDLAHWEQLGYVLDRKEQLPCSYEMVSGGIFAPTIRYHDGVFYMITTNMSMGCKNFIVTATDPKGPWSDMHVIEGADGIDPSLFFDDDGRAYYTGTTRVSEADASYQAIWGCEINLKEMRLCGTRKILWRGAMFNSYAPEGPHIYKKDGWYYLMIAEGGTEHMHAVTISRSKEVLGAYEGYQGNPVLTHRHLGKNYPVCNVGHGDLVELKDGSWYMVMLASRLMDGYHKLLGRETFMAPVTWEDGWPVVSPGTGKVEWTYPQPEGLPEWQPEGRLPVETDTDFDTSDLGMEWNEIGNPAEEFYRIENSCLKLKLLKNELVPWELDGLSANVFERIPLFKGGKKAGFLGRRQQHMQFEAVTKLFFEPDADECAGMTVLQNDANQLRIEIRKNRTEAWKDQPETEKSRAGTGKGQPETVSAVCVSTRTIVRDGRQYFEEKTAGSAAVDNIHGLYIKIRGSMTKYSFYVSVDGISWKPVAEDVDGAFMGSETSGGFIGAYIGLFAYCDTEDRDKHAAFDSFTYKGLDV